MIYILLIVGPVTLYLITQVPSVQNRLASWMSRQSEHLDRLACAIDDFCDRERDFSSAFLQRLSTRQQTIILIGVIGLFVIMMIVGAGVILMELWPFFLQAPPLEKAGISLALGVVLLSVVISCRETNKTAH